MKIIASERQGRRTKRTRQALLDAFLKLLAERRYKNIRVADIAAKADTGRSTFYEHFKDKNDLLFYSMGYHFDLLANVVSTEADTAALGRLLEHYWENRQLAREVMIGPQAPLGSARGARHLAKLIDARLAALLRANKLKPSVPTLLAATQIADGTLAVLRAWLTGEAPCKPDALAKAVHQSAVRTAQAFVEPKTV